MYTNVMEWIQSDALETLLSMCKDPREPQNGTCSDYENFLDFCRCFALLQGNSLANRIAYHLEHTLGIREPITEATCDRIWCLAAERLLADPLPPPDWRGEPPSSYEGQKLFLSAPSLTPVFYPEDPNGALFLCQTHAFSLEEWQSEINDYLQKSKDFIFCKIPCGYRFHRPDPYHIELALKEKKGNSDLLISQLMRILAKECTDRELPLVLRMECDAREAVKLLEYVDERIGLPELVLNPTIPEDIDLLCPLLARKKKRQRRFAGCPLDFDTPTAYHRFLTAYAARYPIGMLGEINIKKAD